MIFWPFFGYDFFGGAHFWHRMALSWHHFDPTSTPLTWWGPSLTNFQPFLMILWHFQLLAIGRAAIFYSCHLFGVQVRFCGIFWLWFVASGIIVFLFHVCYVHAYVTSLTDQTKGRSNLLFENHITTECTRLKRTIERTHIVGPIRGPDSSKKQSSSCGIFTRCFCSIWYKCHLSCILVLLMVWATIWPNVSKEHEKQMWV